MRRPDEVRCPGEPVSGVRRLLVARTDRLGDLVLTLPAVAALRDAYPGSWLGLLVRPEFAALARTFDDVDEVLPHTGDFAACVRTLAAFRPDLLVSVARDDRVARAAREVGVSCTVGSGRRWYSRAFERRVEESRRGGDRHEVEYALSFAHRAGASAGPAAFRLSLPERHRAAVAEWLALQHLERPFVVLHPGSAGSCPAWPIEHYVQLAALLEGHELDAVFSFGPGDRPIERQLADEPARIRRIPRFSGDAVSLAALLDRAACVVAASTGPVHVAAALDTPVVAVHAPWPSCGPDRWGPYSEAGWAVVADDPRARRWSRWKRQREGAALLGRVPPPAVEQIVLDLVEGAASGRGPRDP